jgi:hypothetical protein
VESRKELNGLGDEFSNADLAARVGDLAIRSAFEEEIHVVARGVGGHDAVVVGHGRSSEQGTITIAENYRKLAIDQSHVIDPMLVVRRQGVAVPSDRAFVFGGNGHD